MSGSPHETSLWKADGWCGELTTWTCSEVSSHCPCLYIMYIIFTSLRVKLSVLSATHMLLSVFSRNGEAVGVIQCNSLHFNKDLLQTVKSTQLYQHKMKTVFINCYLGHNISLPNALQFTLKLDDTSHTYILILTQHNTADASEQWAAM